MKRSQRSGISVIDALEKAQRIAFGPFIFQAIRVARANGMLSAVSEAEGGLTPSEICEKTHISPYAAGVLADILIAAEVLTESGDGRLSITKTGECLLFDEMTAVNFDFTADVCYRGLDHLGTALTESRAAGLCELGPWKTIYPAISSLPEPARTSWFAFDHYYSDRCFEELAKKLQRDTCPGVLFDVGGNTGKFSAVCLREMPQAKITLIDLPEQCSLARKNPDLSVFSDRFSCAEVDWLDPQAVPAVTHKADIIWMSQFLDCFSPEKAASILKRCTALLAPGGRFAVLECLTDTQSYPAATLSLAAVSLYFAAMANGNSRFYRKAQLEAIFKAADLEIESAETGLGVSHTLYLLKPRNGSK